MSLPRTYALIVLLGFAKVVCVQAQQAVSSAEQARLVQDSPNSANLNVNADGTALSDQGESDDGLGEQVVFTSTPRNPAFVITGDASVYYTDNAALTRHHTIDDTFFVGSVGMNWTPLVTPSLDLRFAAYGSIFRYDSTPSLDFQSFGVGGGVFWRPPRFQDIELFAYYDFIEMLDRHSNEILRDHEFTLGAQRGFRLGNAQRIDVGGVLMAGIAEPESAQRDLVGMFVAYRLQATRSLQLQIGYRLGGYFYNDSGRVDCTQILSAGAHYRLWEGGSINAFISLSDNRSEDSVFDYQATTGGGGLSASVQF